MKTPAPEFSRAYRLDALGALDRPVLCEANAQERAGLARRFGLIGLDTLTAEAMLHHGAHGIDAQGRMQASGTQACVVTGDPIPFTVDDRFAIRFVAADEPSGEEEIELSEADLDVMEHDGNVIDLGEAVAQTLGLALDPFPRGPHAAAKLKDAGVLDEGMAGPFGALAGLRDKLTGG